jgi:hypothetical protein
MVLKTRKKIPAAILIATGNKDLPRIKTCKNLLQYS